MSDHYAVLGVDHTVDCETLRAAHRARARVCHPDLGGDQAEMMRINEAWRVLRDPLTRAAYDAARGIRRPDTDGRVILSFGRYAGRSLEDVAQVDDDYLSWLERSPAGLGIKRDIRRVLDARQRALDGLRPHAPKQRQGWAFSRS